MKRACPYDANLLRMTKVHLMDYDVDKMALQKVHDDTLMKLRNGANNRSDALDVLPLAPPKPVTPQKPMRQREVTSYFSSTSRISRPSKTVTFCNVEELITCCYCDKVAEANKCVKCDQLFCHRCCFSQYNDNENFICLSCA